MQMTNTRLRYGQCEGLPSQAPRSRNLLNVEGARCFEGLDRRLGKTCLKTLVEERQAWQCVGGACRLPKRAVEMVLRSSCANKIRFFAPLQACGMLCAQLNRHLRCR